MRHHTKRIVLLPLAIAAMVPSANAQEVEQKEAQVESAPAGELDAEVKGPNALVEVTREQCRALRHVRDAMVACYTQLGAQRQAEIAILTERGAQREAEIAAAEERLAELGAEEERLSAREAEANARREGLTRLRDIAREEVERSPE